MDVKCRSISWATWLVNEAFMNLQPHLSLMVRGLLQSGLCNNGKPNLLCSMLISVPSPTLPRFPNYIQAIHQWLYYTSLFFLCRTQNINPNYCVSVFYFCKRRNNKIKYVEFFLDPLIMEAIIFLLSVKLLFKIHIQTHSFLKTNIKDYSYECDKWWHFVIAKQQ